MDVLSSDGELQFLSNYQFALSFQSLKYEPLFQNLDFDQIYHQTIQPIDKFPPDFR